MNEPLIVKPYSLIDDMDRQWVWEFDDLRRGKIILQTFDFEIPTLPMQLV